MTKGKMAFALAGAAALLAGCETAPVREYGPAPVRERVIVRPTEPVVMCTSSDRREWISVAVVKPIGTSLQAAVSYHATGASG